MIDFCRPWRARSMVGGLAILVSAGLLSCPGYNSLAVARDASSDTQAASRQMASVGININNAGWGAPQKPVPREALDLLAKSGAGWIRISLPWAVIQRTEGGPEDWSSYDALVAQFRSKGIRVLFDVRHPPCWARADESFPCAGSVVGSIPKTAPLQAFLTEAVHHFGGQGTTYWEIWNEPNYDQNVHVDGAGNNAEERFDTYATQILIPAARAIHAADPKAMVVAPVLGATARSTSPDEFADRLKEALGGGAAKLIDVVSIHVYPPGDPLEYGEAAHRAMDNLGIGNRPLWLTETGMRGGGIGFGDQSPPADYLTDLFRRNAAGHPPVYGVIFWFALTDSRKPGATFGLVNDDWTVRPSYEALQNLSRDPAIH